MFGSKEWKEGLSVMFGDVNWWYIQGDQNVSVRLTITIQKVRCTETVLPFMYGCAKWWWWWGRWSVFAAMFSKVKWSKFAVMFGSVKRLPYIYHHFRLAQCDHIYLPSFFSVQNNDFCLPACFGCVTTWTVTQLYICISITVPEICKQSVSPLWGIETRQ